MRIRNKVETPNEKSGKKVRVSVTVKWAVATSFFIFVVFSIFAFVAYKTCTQVIYSQEKNNLETTMDEVVTRLSRADHSLTITSANANLRQTVSYGEGNNYTDQQTIEADMLQLNAFISVLSQPELFTFIYNADGKQVFETRIKNIKFTPTKERMIELKTIDGITGFQATQPVYAKSSNELIGYAVLYYELDNYYRISKQLLWALLLLEVIGFLLSSVCGYFLSAYYLRPLKNMVQTIDELQNEPESEQRMPELHTNDEFSDLTDAFNEMLDRMQRYMDSQQSFVEDVSHELRTPVAIIEGHLNLLSRWGKDDPEVLDESIQASLQEITRMKALVQEMLNLSRLEQFDLDERYALTKGNNIVKHTVTNFRLLYPEFEFTYQDLTSGEKWLKMYQNHFEQVLIIILDNAVKYSDSIKKVAVRIKSSADLFQVEIEDFGEGISPENQDKVFNRFYRVDKARSRENDEKGGHGLGLSIAKQLIDNVQGTIFAESEVGKGTIFIIQIPIANDDLR